MISRFKLFIASLLLAIGICKCANANDFTTSFTSGGLAIETYAGHDETVVIPSQINGYPVRCIAKWAFTGDDIECIVIPATVVNVSDKAFYGCRSLVSIEFQGRLPEDSSPFKGLSTQNPPVVRHWDSFVAKDKAEYRGLVLERAWQEPMPVPTRMDGGKGHLFENSLTLAFPQVKAGQTLRYNERFQEPTSQSPTIENGATKTIFQDCNLSLRIFADDGTPLSGTVFTTFGCLDNPPQLTTSDLLLRLCTCQGEPGRLEIEGIKTCSPVVILPSELDGKPLFNLCTPMAGLHNTLAIVLPENVGQCGYSFASPTLEYIQFSDGIKRLTSGIASNCTALSKVVLPSSVSAIGDDAFANCTELDELLLPPALSVIGKRAFLNCKSLTSVTFPSLVGRIDEDAFAGCDNLTTVVFCGAPPQISGTVFPESVKQINVQANLGWPDTFGGIPVVPIEANLRIVRTDGEDSDFFTDALSVGIEVQPSFVSLQYSINGASPIRYDNPFSIASDALVTAQALVNGQVYGPAISRQFVKANDDHQLDSFDLDCESGAWVLRKYHSSLSLPQGIFVVDGLAAKENILKSLYIPSTVTRLAGEQPMSGPAAVNPFAGQAMLKSIFVSKDNGCFKVIDGVLFDAECTTLLAYPSAREGTSYRIPDGVLHIASEAFACAKNLQSIQFPESLLTIGKGAFRNMEGLTEIDFPALLEVIPPSACMGCTSLTEVSMPLLLERISRSAFEGCASLRSIQLPPFLSVIGDNAFRNCANLQNIEIPAALELLCISALFGVHDDCKLNFNGIEGIEESYNTRIVGNGALRDEETGEYMLPHLVISYWGSSYWNRPEFWCCFEDDDSAYEELLTLVSNNIVNGWIDLDYTITVLDDELDSQSCSMELSFDWSDERYDNAVLCYTLDGTAPSFENGIVADSLYNVSIAIDEWPILFRASIFDADSGEQIQGEINFFAREAAEGQSFFTYSTSYNWIQMIENLDNRFITRGSLNHFRNAMYYDDEDDSAFKYTGNLLALEARGDATAIIDNPPVWDIFDAAELAQEGDYHRVIEIVWTMPKLEWNPKEIFISKSVSSACIDWKNEGEYVNGYFDEVNPFALLYELEEESDDEGNLRIDAGVLFAGNTLVAYPGAMDGESYIIPRGTKTILFNAFCRNDFSEYPLNQVAVPASVTFVWGYAFSNCSHITDLYFLGKKPNHFDYSTIFEERNKFCTLHALPNSGFQKEYDDWWDEQYKKLYKDYRSWRNRHEHDNGGGDDDYYGDDDDDYYYDDYSYRYYYDDMTFDSFEDYVDYWGVPFFWNAGYIMTEGVPPVSFTLQDDGRLAIELQEDDEMEAYLFSSITFRYTTDGSIPGVDSALYKAPIEIPDDCKKLKAIVCIDGYPVSIPAVYNVRWGGEEEESYCDDEWVLLSDVVSPSLQPVLTPPGHAEFVYRRTEDFQVEADSRLSFQWKLDSNDASMALKLNGRIIARHDGYTPWQTMSMVLKKGRDYRLEWYCDYSNDGLEGEYQPDMFLSKPQVSLIPQSFSVMGKDGSLIGYFEPGELVCLLPDLYCDKRFLKWNVVSKNANLTDGVFVMPQENVVVNPLYSQFTAYKIRPGWNLLSNIWLFEDARLSSECTVFAYNGYTNTYVRKRLDEIADGEVFWLFFDGRYDAAPIFAGGDSSPYQLTKGWQLVPGNITIPSGGRCFMFERNDKFRELDDNPDDASVGYWLFIP